MVNQTGSGKKVRTCLIFYRTIFEFYFYFDNGGNYAETVWRASSSPS